MAGFSSLIAAHRYKQALFDAATELWRESHPEFLVCWGKVGANVPDQYVEFHGTDNTEAPATMGTNRTSEETLRLETMWWVTRFGDAEIVGPEADLYLFDRLAELEHYVRVTNTTLGGVVRHCRVTTFATDDAAMNRDNSYGRLSAAVAIFEAKVRLSN